MDLLESLLEKASAAMNSSPAASRARLSVSVRDLLNDPSVGGLDGLIGMFNANGLLSILASWIGLGENESIMPEQIAQVFGPDRLQQFARSAGISAHRAPHVLADLLPGIVDKLTPGGKLPDSILPEQVESLLQSNPVGALETKEKR